MSYKSITLGLNKGWFMNISQIGWSVYAPNYQKKFTCLFNTPLEKFSFVETRHAIYIIDPETLVEIDDPFSSTFAQHKLSENLACIHQAAFYDGAVVIGTRKGLMRVTKDGTVSQTEIRGIIYGVTITDDGGLVFCKASKATIFPFSKASIIYYKKGYFKKLYVADKPVNKILSIGHSAIFFKETTIFRIKMGILVNFTDHSFHYHMGKSISIRGPTVDHMTYIATSSIDSDIFKFKLKSTVLIENSPVSLPNIITPTC